MADYVTDTQALIKFMMGKKVINDKAHQAFLSADKGESTIIIPAVVLNDPVIRKSKFVKILE